MDGLGLTAAEQRELDTRLQRKQMQEFASAFSNLVSHCFDSCVDDFTTKSLISREQGCVSRCVQKFMAGQERISQRYGELNMQMMNQQQGR